MEYIFNTRLRGNIALTDSYHTNLALQKDNTLYKFIWVQAVRCNWRSITYRLP